jgi:hypothetical protein
MAFEGDIKILVFNSVHFRFGINMIIFCQFPGVLLGNFTVLNKCSHEIIKFNQNSAVNVIKLYNISND